MKIYLLKIKHSPNWFICKEFHQYGFEEGHELFSYKEYISLKRKVTREEAEKLYELISQPTGLCAGKPLETIEL